LTLGSPSPNLIFMRDSEQMPVHLAELQGLGRVLDKAKLLVELHRTHGPYYAASVFCDYADHCPDSLEVYAKFAARLVGDLARVPGWDARSLGESLTRMADVVAKRRG